MNVLEKHDLHLIVAEIFGKKVRQMSSEKESSKIIAAFCSNWQRHVENLIAELNTLITSQTGEVDTGTEAIMVLAEVEETFFQWQRDADGLHEAVATIPTQDFRDILLEWKAFLEKKI